MMDELLSQDEINALLSGQGFGAATGGSDAGGAQESTKVLDDVAGLFATSFGSVFGMLAGKDVHATVTSKETIPQKDFVSKPGDAAFCFRVSASGLDDAPTVLVMTRTGALTLADLMMGGEGKDLPSEASELFLNAAQEGLSQVVGAAFTSMSGLLGGRRLLPENVSSALETEAWLPFAGGTPDDPSWVVSISVSIEGLNAFPLWLLLPMPVATKIAEEIEAAMAPKEAPKPATGQQQPPAASRAQSVQPAQPSAPSMAAAAYEPPTYGNIVDQSSVDVRPAEFIPLTQKAASGPASRIDLIADIPVRVTVELGRTRKNISDILNMTPGSVIELDKMAGEPVDVLVNSKLIAKGEVVVIDENFGVRITEIVSSSGKVRSL